MKYILIVVLIVLSVTGGLYYWDKQTQLEPLFAQPYAAIYGRDTCGYTQKYKQDAVTLGLRVVPMDIDDQAVADVLHARMKKAGLNITQYELPVLDINGKILVRPPMDEVTQAYHTRTKGPGPRFDISKLAFDLSSMKFDLPDVIKQYFPNGGKKTPPRHVNPIVYKEGEIRLEGISLGDPVVVMINGHMYKQGEKFGDHTVIWIKKNSVLLRNSKGEEVIKSLR